MKRSSIIEARRKQVNPEVRQRVDFSFQIVDRIYEIFQAHDGQRTVGSTNT